uniref:Immunoglobulin V-set domain-containing protein n=1 Tax=Salmo trutta TaxID=8032 RepID=A0A674F3H1_SALTR
MTGKRESHETEKHCTKTTRHSALYCCAGTSTLVQEGRNVHLSCKYDGIVYNLQWYRQYSRSQPEFLLYITPNGSPDVTDSALYYYAMKTTVTGNCDTVQKPWEETDILYDILK